MRRRALGRSTDPAIAALAAVATIALTDVGAGGGRWRDRDTNHDGVISIPEACTTIEQLGNQDQHLGDCDQLDRYQLDPAGWIGDHTSLGLGVHAVPSRRSDLSAG